MKKLILLIIAIALMPVASPTHAQDGDLETVKREAMVTYADIVFASYEDSLTLAIELQVAIDAFIAEPSEETHQLAKDAWLAANEPYGQTEAYRFYGGPIDDADGPEGLMNAWPLDEAYVDYVDGMPSSGIINDLENYPEITADVLESLNEQGAEENISVGYHAIEFLLWGQDFNDDGPGDRSYTDYTTADNADRRGQYLSISTDLLVGHLQDMVDAWAPNVDDNYRAEFLALDTDTAFSHMLTGIGVLSKSELAGERMFVALDNQDQEDEHSCFSDNTHRDIVTNAQGIYNVYVGEYVRLDGTVVEGVAIEDVMAIVDPELNDAILAQLDTTLELVNAIPAPFDRAIVEEDSRIIVLDAVFALQDQGDLFAEAGTALELTINTALPE